MKDAIILALSLLAFGLAGAEEEARDGATTTGNAAGNTNAPVETTTQTNVVEVSTQPDPLLQSEAGIVQVTERPDTLFQSEAGEGISFRLSPQSRTELADESLARIYSKLELRAPRPINVVRSEEHPGNEYSGILVSVIRGNPLQLINPVAPAEYGDSQDNVHYDSITKRVEGARIVRFSF